MGDDWMKTATFTFGYLWGRSVVDASYYAHTDIQIYVRVAYIYVIYINIR